MMTRGFWHRRIEEAWGRRSVIWLSGVRRVGKTVLCQTLPSVEYFDCELPRTRRQMQDPEAFLGTLSGKRVVLDEVHRLPNPSELLKIAADHFRDIRIIATGSSTLGASRRFRDTLTGRKTDLWLTPMVEPDLRDFGNTDIRHRLLHGGLPPFFLSQAIPDRDYQEWIDAYWAKDIQELFRLARRDSFQRFLELVLINSGGIFEASRYAGPCEVSRPTIVNYLRVLEATHVAHVIRPFAHRRATEIVAAPKVYGFDTGFVCYYRGWRDLRDDDLGPLWEHFVLNELHGQLQSRAIRYWRDKRGHEVDFVLPGSGRACTTIECKWAAERYEPASLLAFRRRYPRGPNFLVAADVGRPWKQRFREVEVHVISLPDLVDAVRGWPQARLDV